MIKLDDNLLAEIGLTSLSAEDKKRMLTHIYETLEMRVGMELAKQMSDAQLSEFEQFINRNDEAGALRWLETNFPNYKDVVAAEFEKLKAEIKQVAPQIVADAQAAAASQPQPQFGTPGQPQAAPPYQPTADPYQQSAQPAYNQPQAAPAPDYSYQQPTAPVAGQFADNNGAGGYQPPQYGTTTPQNQGPYQQPAQPQPQQDFSSNQPYYQAAPVQSQQYGQPANNQPQYPSPAPMPGQNQQASYYQPQQNAGQFADNNGAGSYQPQSYNPGQQTDQNNTAQPAA